MPLTLSLSLLSVEEEEQLVSRTNARLKNFEDFKTLEIEDSIFDKGVENFSEKEAVGKTSCQKEKELAEIQKMILDDDSGDEDDLDKMLNEGFPIEIDDDAEDVINLEGEAIFNNSLDQSALEGMEDDDEIEIIEIIEPKSREKAVPNIKKEVKREQVEEDIGGTELAPTPSPSEPSDLYELKVEVEVEISAEDVAPAEEDSVTLNKFCRICYHTFSKDVEQLAHERKVHNNEEDQYALNLKTTSLTINDFVHSCNLCGLKFITNNCLKIHSKEIHRIGLEITGKCKVCQKNVAKEHMKRHMRIEHQTGLVRCSLCYKTFASASNLKNHESFRHLEEKEFVNIRITENMLVHPCNICDKRFVTESLLNSHSEEHQHYGDCKLCYKTFSHGSRSNMERHNKFAHKNEAEFLGREIDKSELKYPCDLCPKAFVKESIMKKHATEHELSKYEYLRYESLVKVKDKSLYKCKLCYLKYDRFNVLAKHITANHEKDGEYLKMKITPEDCVLRCKNCDIAFITENAMHCHSSVKHRSSAKSLNKPRLFKDDEPKQCKLCYKICANSYGLKCHENIIHREDQKYLDAGISDELLVFECDTCMLKFVTKKLLKTHTGEKHENECKLCYKNIKDQKDMKRHVDFAHKQEIEYLSRPIKTSELIFPCQICSRKCLTRNILAVHQKLHEEKLACKLCYKKVLPSAVGFHNNYSHSEDQEYLNRNIEAAELKFSCSKCPKKFVKEDLLIKHKASIHESTKYEFLKIESRVKKEGKSSSKRYKCKFCYGQFEVFTQLLMHILTKHKSEENLLKTQIRDRDCKFTCRKCSQKFVTENVLTYHIDKKHSQVHTASSANPLAIYCKLCIVNFKNNSNFAKHKDNIHKQFPDEMEALESLVGQSFKLKCKFCSENFMNLHVLNYHVSYVHREEKKTQDWICQYCNFAIKPSNERWVL